MASTTFPPSTFAPVQREAARAAAAFSQLADAFAGVDYATDTTLFYWTAPNTALPGQWTGLPGQWYVAPVYYQGPALSPRAVAQLNLARARRWEFVLEPRALRHRAPRLTVAPRTRRAGRQPVSATVRHVRQTRRR